MQNYQRIFILLMSITLLQAEDIKSNMADVLWTVELHASEGNKAQAVDGIIKNLTL